MSSEQEHEDPMEKGGVWHETKITMPCPAPDRKGDLVIRTNRATGEEFLGCSFYPECRHTQPLTEYLKMKRLGAPTLF